MERYYKRVFSKKAVFLGVEFRSKMECDFARFLSGVPFEYKGVRYWHEAVDWEYEAYEFELIPQEEWCDRTEREARLKRLVRNKRHTLQRVIYTPDFYLPKHDLYIEVKGKAFDDELFRLRLRLFRHVYPNCKLWVVRHHEEFFGLDGVLENIKIGEERDDEAKIVGESARA